MECLSLFAKALIELLGGILWFGWFIFIPSQLVLAVILLVGGMKEYGTRWTGWLKSLVLLGSGVLFLVWFAAFHATRLCYGFMIGQGEFAGGWGETIGAIAILALLGVIVDIVVGWLIILAS